MQRDPEKYLFDIVDSCRFLRELAGRRTLADYQADRAFRFAVERGLQITGEALLQLSRIRPDIVARISEHHRIIGFRHILVHGYDVLDHDIVWNIVDTKLPVLLTEAEAILAELGRNQG